MSTSRALLILVHGHHGAGSDFNFMAAEFRRVLDQAGAGWVRVVQSRRNSYRTNCGIDQLANNLLLEIRENLDDLNSTPDDNHEKNGELRATVPVRVAFVAHSLGGLVCRAVLHKLQPEVQQGRVEFSSLVTICTPHLGSRKPKRTGSVGKAMWRTLVHAYLHGLSGKTGAELAMDDNEPSLLMQLSDPQGVHMPMLAMVKHRTMLGITHNDLSVPYCSAMASFSRPRGKLETPPSRPVGVSIVGCSGFTTELASRLLGHRAGQGEGAGAGAGGGCSGGGQEIHASHTHCDCLVHENCPPGPGSQTTATATANDDDNDDDVATTISGETANPANPGSNLNAGPGLVTDHHLEVEFPMALFQGVNSVSWRRVAFEVRLGSRFLKAQTHNVSLGGCFGQSKVGGEIVDRVVAIVLSDIGIDVMQVDTAVGDDGVGVSTDSDDTHKRVGEHEGGDDKRRKVVQQGT